MSCSLQFLTHIADCVAFWFFLCIEGIYEMICGDPFFYVGKVKLLSSFSHKGRSTQLYRLSFFFSLCVCVTLTFIDDHTGTRKQNFCFHSYRVPSGSR